MKHFMKFMLNIILLCGIFIIGFFLMIGYFFILGIKNGMEDVILFIDNLWYDTKGKL